MSKIIDALDTLAKQKYYAGWDNPGIRKFVESGDRVWLSKVPALRDISMYSLSASLPDPDQWTEEAARVLVLANTKQLSHLLRQWLGRYCHYSSARWEHFERALEILRSCGLGDIDLRNLLVHCSLWHLEKDVPTPAGLLYLQASDSEIKLATQNTYSSEQWEIAALLAHSQPDRLEKLLREKVTFGFTSEASLHNCLIRANPLRFADAAAEALKSEGKVEERLILLRTLGKNIPDRFLEQALREHREFLPTVTEASDYIGRVCVEFLLEHNDPATLQLACGWIAGWKGANSWNAPHQRELILKRVEEKAPQYLPEMAKACARCAGAANVIQLGLRYLRQLGVKDEELYHEAIRKLLALEDPKTIVAGIGEARDWNLTRTAEDLWPFMLHKSRPVRSAGARALSGLGYETAGKRALELLSHKKAEVRQSAVLLLNQIGGESAIGALKARLDVEENDDVRDSILLALENSGGATLTPEERQTRLAKTVAKSKGAPADWIHLDQLQLYRRDGSQLTHDETLYLLIRQSRCKEMRADLEAKWLFAQLDRAKSGAAGLALLNAFLGSKQDAADRWVLAFVALTGDDRTVPILRKSIIDWAENSRGKLAEYGTQALAMLGTDPALMVVDSLSVRFRSKNKNIGQAAADAFAAAAEARGVSVEELGDLVVPWLGFEPNKPRLISGSKAEVEARIGSDLKLTFRDTKTGKLAAKIPAGVSAEIQAEFKLLAATVKEATKAQLLRIETLLVRQFRWPVERWRELYLAHPLLLPFAQRLVWGWLNDADELKHTFRALEDATLTDFEDNPVELPSNGTVSLVHPLDLDDETRSTWINHLADYEIAPPFPQLDRPVVRVKPEENGLKFGDLVNGTDVNAMTFRSRAEKLGWVRGSVVDAGGVSTYRKVFSGSGVEAFLGLDGMYVGIGMEDSITLQQFCFVRAGAVKIGSYTYDEPGDEKDPRLIPFGEVPPVPYSEVIGDLMIISGKGTEEPPPAA